MWPTASLALMTAFLAYVLNILLPWIRNIRTARSTGLPYVVVPYYVYNRLRALVLGRTLLRLCSRFLGVPSPTSWRTLVTGWWPLKHRYAPFALLGSDSFVTVAPGGFAFHTADPDVIAQITSRPTDFPKATHLYSSTNIYGENVLTTEGSTWRYHRKLTSSMFGENNNQLVWKQSLRDGRSMLSGWLQTRGKAVTTLAQDTMLLSLSVIGNAGLGQTIQWPSASPISDQSHRKSKETDASDGHQMTFTIALTTLIRNVYYVVLLPMWFLRIVPSEGARRSYLAYHEWKQYMHEIISAKREALDQLGPSASAVSGDLLSQLLKEHEPSLPARSKSSSDPRPTRQLSDSEILGNLFIMVIAGHETSANSIHFCLALLAMHPDIQREVQQDLDQIFLHRPSDEQWDYERDLPSLMNSKLNAVLSEELRLLPAAIVIPKYTTTPQTLTVNGRDVTVPAKTIMRICVTSVHQNPKCWTALRTDGRSVVDDDTVVRDLETFRPSRWLASDPGPSLDSASETTGFRARSWYHPPKGAYLPFSDGARACLGRRFAQIEILVVLALILSKHSVELAFDDLQTDDQSKIKEAWGRARDEAEHKLRNDTAVFLTLQLKKGQCIPVNIVERGAERMKDLV